MITPVTRPDPVTLAVIEAGVTAAADEMFAVLKKTAMSPIISEVLDAGTGVALTLTVRVDNPAKSRLGL